MIVKPLRDDLEQLLRTYQIEGQFNRKVNFIEQIGTGYRSLHFKPLQDTKHMKDPNRLYEFRINDHYRAYCIKPEPNELEVVAIDPHTRV